MAAVILEPVQNAGGCLVPPDGYFQRVREICDEYDVLLISDEVICSLVRLGEGFGSAAVRLPARHHHHRQGPDQRLCPDGGDDRHDRVAEPFMQGGNRFIHGATLGGIRDAAIALANLDAFEREGVHGQRARHEAAFRAMLDSLRDLPIVGDVRGDGLLPRDRAGQGQADQGVLHDEESETLLRGFLCRDVRARPDLPLRRPRRPGDPALAAADRRPRAVRRDRGGPAARARGGRTAHDPRS